MSKVAERTYTERKTNFIDRIGEYVEEYSKVFLVHADNVGSLQIQQIRRSLRGKAQVLMGKNTMIRMCFRKLIASNPKVEALLPLIRGNVGFVFTNEDLCDIRDIILANKMPAPAKANTFAPLGVDIPAGITTMGPGDTGFFQALGIATKITKGSIEILNEVNLIKAGDKITESQVALLSKLNITPFSYGLKVMHVYDDGSVFSPSVLDITDEDLYQSFASGIAQVASVSLAIGYPTSASVPHSIINGFKNCLAIAAVTDISFTEAEQMKAYLADPSAFAAAAPAEEAKEEAKEVAKESSESESSDGGMGFGMFD